MSLIGTTAQVTRKKNRDPVLLLPRVSIIQTRVKSHLSETHLRVGPLRSIQLLQRRNLASRKQQEVV